jgi:formylglycine-generating enzyme required for sulfatase activity
MTSKDLRTLAKDYAEGAIDRDAYRKARSELIDGILAGDVEVLPRDFPPPLDNSEGDPTVESIIKVESSPKPSKQYAKQPQQLPPDKTHHYWLIGGSVVTLTCLIVLVFLYTKQAKLPMEGSNDAEEQTSEQVTERDTVTVVSSNAGDALIGNFLNENNWSVENLQQILLDWQNLSTEERSAGLSSVTSRQLINAIHKQLTEERGLLGLGDNASVIARQQTLVDFAGSLGIQDSRLTVVGDVEEVVEPEIKTETSTPVNTVVIPDLSNEMSEQASIEEEVQATLDGNRDTESADIAKDETATSEASQALAAAETIEETAPVVTESSAATEKKTTVTKKANKNACRTELAKKRKPYCRDEIAGTGYGPTLAVIGGGNFTMGGDKPTEQPAHDVTIDYPLAISVREISYGEFKKYCEAKQRQCPEQPWVGKDYPVVNVSWNDAIAYTQWLTEKTGNTYRLPNESEWEYAARAGTTTPYPFGDEILISDAVFSDRKQLNAPLPRTDRSINRNKFKLYHMVGNVREWATDDWHEDYDGAPSDGSARYNSGTPMRVIRGGSYADSAEALRSGAREKQVADTKDKFTGFRIVQELSN